MKTLARSFSCALLLLSPLGSILSATLPPCFGATFGEPALYAQEAVEKIGSISFTGADIYAARDLVPLTGLHLGETINPDTLQKGAQALYDSGFFADAQASASGEAGARAIVFELKTIPPANLPRAIFANFIWVSTDEINSALHQQLPMYQGGIPVTGPLAAEVNTALERILLAHHVTAKVAYGVLDVTPLHPDRTVEYRVTAPSIRVEHATINGAPPQLIQAEIEAQALAVATPFGASVTTDILLAPARHDGYIDAKLEAIQLGRRDLPNSILLTFTARLNAGPQYRVTTITWLDTPVYSSSEFGRERKLQPGDIASDTAILEAEQPVLAAYHSAGYMDAQVFPSLALDAAHRTVAVTYSCTPGEPYRVKSVTATGLSEAAKAEFDANWKMGPGIAYDASYATNFLAANPSLQALNHYTFTFSTATDPSTHQVDLTIAFKPLP